MACYYQFPNGRFYILVTGEGTGGWTCNGVGGYSAPGFTFPCGTNGYTFDTISTSTITLSDPVATYTATGTSGDCDIVFTFTSGDDSAATEFTMYGWCYPQAVHVALNGGVTIAPGVATDLLLQNDEYPPRWLATSIPNPGSPANDPLPSINYYYGVRVNVQGQEGVFDDINIPDGGNLCGGTQLYTDGSGGSATVTPVTGAFFTSTPFSPAFAMPGDVVTIYGSGFTGTTSVTFNGTPAGTFTVRSDGVITAVVPSGVTPGPISITNGVTSTTEQNLFTTTVIPGPAIWHYNNG